MGWMGWEPAVVLATDVNLITMALDSRRDLISMVFGDGRKAKGKKKRLSAEDFKAFASRHNASRSRETDG